MARTKEEQRAYAKAYYVAHREAIKARVRAYAVANKDAVRIRAKQYQQAHVEEISAKNRERYLANRKERIAKQIARDRARWDEVTAYKKAWNAKNSERLKPIKAAKYAALSDEERAALSERSKKKYQDNPEKIKARTALYRQLNKEAVNAYHREYGKRYRSENKAKIQAKNRAYAINNPDKVRESGNRRKARLRNARIEDISFKSIRDNFDGYCGICKGALDISTDPYHYDHIVPLAAGGTHATTNIQIAHAKCNLKKGARVA